MLLLGWFWPHLALKTHSCENPYRLTLQNSEHPKKLQLDRALPAVNAAEVDFSQGQWKGNC